MAEINKIETKKIIQGINETKSWFFKKNQQNRQTFTQTNQKTERKLSKLTKSEIKLET